MENKINIFHAVQREIQRVNRQLIGYDVQFFGRLNAPKLLPLKLSNNAEKDKGYLDRLVWQIRFVELNLDFVIQFHSFLTEVISAVREELLCSQLRCPVVPRDIQVAAIIPRFAVELEIDAEGSKLSVQRDCDRRWGRKRAVVPAPSRGPEANRLRFWLELSRAVQHPLILLRRCHWPLERPEGQKRGF